MQLFYLVCGTTLPFFIVFILGWYYKNTSLTIICQAEKLLFILPSTMPNCIQPLNIVLVEPEIPPNTGSIARLCGATNSVLHLVHPLGFSTDDKHLKRAGLDYWEFVTIIHWNNLDEFLDAQNERDLFFFTTKVEKKYTDAQYHSGCFLIFGKETKGLPEDTLRLYHDRCYTLPMENPNIRSLNLAMTAGIVLYEALRQNSQALR